MSTFEADLAEYKRLFGLNAQDAAAISERSKHLHAARERVEAALASGATTGDPLRDMAIRAYGLHEDIYEGFRELQERLRGRTREWVLICYRYKHSPTRFPTREQLEFSTTGLFRLATIADDKLRLGEWTGGPLIEVPITAYVQGTWPQSEKYQATLKDDAKLVLKNLFGWVVSTEHDGPDFLERFLTAGPDEEDKKWHRLVIGKCSVIQAFDEIQSRDVLKAAVRKLDLLVTNY